MSKKCPMCSSGNIVGFKDSYECFDCNHAWKKSSLSRNITIRGFSIPLWAILLIASIVVVAVAIPASWFLLAKGTITIRAAPSGLVTVETINPLGGDFGSIILNPGEGRAVDLVFRVNVAGRAYGIEGVYVCYNPYPPYKELTPQLCSYGDSLDSMTNRCDRLISWEGGAYSENGWVCRKFNFDFPGLTPGTYYFKLTFSIAPGYPDQDTSFDFRIYINFTEAK